MSTYYYMSCEECKKRTKNMIAVCRLEAQHIDNSESFLDFLVKHRDHLLKFFSEYDDERLDYEKEI